MVRRRSDAELVSITQEVNALTYGLVEQVNFTGTQEDLKRMQDLERSYMDGYPKVSDEEWERMKHRWNYEESLMAVAPSGREWLKLYAPLPSINKAWTVGLLEGWYEKWKGHPLKVECKLDGITLNLRYALEGDGKSYRLQAITSRGNGRYGMRLHPHALDGVRLVGVPQVLEAVQLIAATGLERPPAGIELRGEAVISKLDPESVTYMQSAVKALEGQGFNLDGLEPANLPVWRSVVSGMCNRKLPANLPGLLQALYDTSMEEAWKGEVPGLELTVMNGEPALQVTDMGNARLFASVVGLTVPRGAQVLLLAWNDIAVVQRDGSVEIRKDPGEALHVVTYSVSVNGLNLDVDLSKVDGLETVDHLRMMDGSPSPIFRVVGGLEGVLEAVQLFYGVQVDGKRNLNLPRMRNLHEYACDGVVVKVLDSTMETQGLQVRRSASNRNKLVIPKWPEDQIAVKLESEAVTVQLERVDSRVTALGNVTLQGVLDRGYLTESGAVVKNINLHNPEWLAANPWIQVGVPLKMIMSMDVIPVLVEV